MRPSRPFDREVSTLHSIRRMLDEITLIVTDHEPQSHATARALASIEKAERLLSGAATALREAEPLKKYLK